MKNHSKRNFWVPVFCVFAPIAFFLFYIQMSLKTIGIVLFLLFSLFIGGFIHGWKQGREKLREVFDFMEPGLRWKVLDAENRLHDKEDREYEESQKLKG